MITSILLIVLLTYFGTGILFAMHLFLSFQDCKKVVSPVVLDRAVTDPNAVLEAKLIVRIALQPGGLYGTMGRVVLMPWHILRVAKEIV